MNKIFKYCLLQYRHSQSLGEKLNLGLLLIFPLQKHMVFLHPERFGRAKAAYASFPEKVVKSTFKGIIDRVAQLNQQPEILASYHIDEDRGRFINEEILIPDASALQFGEVRTGVQYTEDLDLISQQYYKLFLSLYDFDEQDQRHDANYLIRRFKKALFKTTDEAEKLFKEQKIKENVEINVGKAVLDFAFGWQNGTYNLVQPVSFDLKRADRIEDKAFQHYGKVDLLFQEAETKYRVDYLVARPTRKALFKAYDTAVELLQRKGGTTIVEENEIEQYSEKALEYLLDK